MLVYSKRPTSVTWKYSLVTSLTPASYSSLDCPCQNHGKFHPHFEWVSGAQHSLCFSFQGGGNPGNIIWLRRISYFSDTLVVYQDIKEVSSSGSAGGEVTFQSPGDGWVWVGVFPCEELRSF